LFNKFDYFGSVLGLWQRYWLLSKALAMPCAWAASIKIGKRNS
jgi:hypothetical protein